MIFKKYISVFWLALALAMIGLMLLAWTPLPTQAGPELPSRATPTPVPRPDADDDKDHKPIGAYIELQPQGAPNGTWAVVQWQDSAGDWHDVEGWQGPLHGGTKKWWVSQGDFGKGPFRWTVYQGQEGELLATSAPFYLPGTASELVRVEVTIIP